MTMAQEAVDSEFSAYVFARMAQCAAGSDDRDRVLGLARAASRFRDAGPHVLAFAALQEAHGHSIARENAAFQRAIEKSRRLIAGHAIENSALGSFCTAQYIWAQEGEGWLRLNRPQDAVRCFDQAPAIWPSSYQRERGLYLSRAAVAQVANGEPDEAATVALDALTLADLTGSTRIKRQVFGVSKMLSTFSDRSAVAKLVAALSTPPSLS
jgi:tetratricopeptide (TPR) repeat protein